MSIRPRAKAPPLVLETLGGRFDLATRTPARFTVIVFYRGVHCGFCRRYLQELESLVASFVEIGVEPIAVSCDDRERAEKAKRDWGLNSFPIAYSLSLDSAMQWGLFISTGIKTDQPDYFPEPGLFLIEPDGVIHAAYIQSWPFARPRLIDVRDAIVFGSERGKPARGELTAISQTPTRQIASKPQWSAE